MNKNISDYIGKELIFVKKQLLGTTYELKYENEVLCQMKIKNVFTKRATVSGFLKDDIEFYKNSFWSNETCIRNINNELPFATYKSPILSLSGTIFLPVGEQLFVKYDLLGLNYEVRDQFNQTLIKLKNNIFYPRAKVEVIRKSNLIDKHPWILALLFYVMLKRRSK
ncbi:MAG: hypothetical protein QHH13_12815 [Melioribacter sp.]|uniref:hypothetical protein n=1 Tax=Rosettibacter primus TaxID=3111523 RepID=UPI00247C2020|nr:hypothetical protein [Melioribacter sp.]